jgi:putative endonuclease
MLFWKKQEENKSMGAEGEKRAADFLKHNGYAIVARNFKNNRGRRVGEIDVIAKKGEEIIFVEVKTRELSRYGNTLPEENITASKLHKLDKIATAYIRINKLWNHPYRFDAVSVWLSDDFKEMKIKHIENIFI